MQSHKVCHCVLMFSGNQCVKNCIPSATILSELVIDLTFLTFAVMKGMYRTVCIETFRCKFLPCGVVVPETLSSKTGPLCHTCNTLCSPNCSVNNLFYGIHFCGMVSSATENVKPMMSMISFPFFFFLQTPAHSKKILHYQFRHKGIPVMQRAVKLHILT